MRSLLKLSYQHLPFTVHSLVHIKAQNKLNLLVWHGMGRDQCWPVFVCLCARKPHGRGQMHGMALGKPAWTCCSMHGWAAPFSVLWEYSGCWSGFSPSPKKARYKRLQIYNFPIEIKMWPNTNCKQGRDFCTGKWHWSSGTSLRRHGRFLQFIPHSIFIAVHQANGCVLEWLLLR